MNNTTFNRGEIIQHVEDDTTNPYYYIVLDTFSKYTIEYYNLFSLVQGREVTLRMDHTKYYHVVSGVS